MKNIPGNLQLLIKRIAILMLVYTLCRFIFLLFNISYFSDVPSGNLLMAFFFGLRFDITAIVILNIFFIVLHFIPFRFFYQRWYQLILSIIFLLVNIPAIILSGIDFSFFRFTLKRSTADLFKVMSFGNDFVNTVPGMILDFWYVLLIVILICIFMVYLYRKSERNFFKKFSSGTNKISPVKSILFHLLVFGLTFIGFRGGIQYRPVSIISASQYSSGKETALILNTPLSIIKTYGKGYLNEVHFFPDDEVQKIAPFIHRFSSPVPFRKLNVVVIILEGIGKEYFGSLNNYPGYTPFLDSLIKESLVFTNAYANGKRSIEGIPNILGGIPSLMNEPFVTSAYSGNTISGLASLLKKKGYATSFYHGGTNGTMNFDNFCHLAGFDHYYGRREYNNDKDFDGNWGIYDEPFLQYFAAQLNGTQQPFLSSVFTLSSHHPFSVPEKYDGIFKKGTLPIHASVMYADYALKKFFETVSKTSWFDSTLFVITSDHTALSEYSFYESRVGMYSIPVIFYQHHSALKGSTTLTVQQIDLIPGILDYLHYDESFFSFGNSVFDTTADHFAINHTNDTYQMISGEYSLILDTLRENSLYHFTEDSLMQKNILNAENTRAMKMERTLKAFIQNYNKAMMENKMTVQ